MCRLTEEDRYGNLDRQRRRQHGQPSAFPLPLLSGPVDPRHAQCQRVAQSEDRVVGPAGLDWPEREGGEVGSLGAEEPAAQAGVDLHLVVVHSHRRRPSIRPTLVVCFG